MLWMSVKHQTSFSSVNLFRESLPSSFAGASIASPPGFICFSPCVRIHGWIFYFLFLKPRDSCNN